MGLAYDYDEEVMYAMSAEGVASGTSALHTVDLENGAVTLIGSQNTATAIACIAIDGDGIMYGLNLDALGNIYIIDKADGSVTVLGSIGQGAAGMGHGMDYCAENETMYLVTYNSFTFESTLRTVNLTDGSSSAVGTLVTWTSSIAIPPNFAVEFSADPTSLCVNGSVDFTNESTAASSYNWTFEGGTPATSTEQHPTITYNTPGVYDVTLVASNGSSDLTLLKTEYITVNDVPGTPDTPTGDENTCTGSYVEYSTNDVLYADTYIWEVLPADAGSIDGTGNPATFIASDSWTGDYTVKVKASNSCGESLFSSELSCVLSQSPSEFELSEGGSTCEGGDGVEITLSGSEIGVDYTLYREGTMVGEVVPGTGDEISFGFFTQAGYYSAEAVSGDCIAFMIGDALITLDALPAMTDTPTGPEMVCDETTTEYEVAEVEDAISYVWTILPEEAGTISGEGLIGTVEWNMDYEGEAEISANAENECGAGPASEALVATVNTLPLPVITGDDLVCQDEEENYTTTNSDYSNYMWTVVGGDIVSGQGTNTIAVLWTAEPGMASVDVIESKGDICEGDAETFDVTIDECTSVNENAIKSLKVYPNPASNMLNIGLSDIQSHKITMNLVNAEGKIVHAQKINNQSTSLNTSIDVSGLPQGIYYLVFTDDTETITRKKVLIMK